MIRSRSFIRTVCSSAAIVAAGSAFSVVAIDLAHGARGEKASAIEDELKLKSGDEQGNEVKALKTEMLVMRSEKKALEQLEKLKVRYKGTRMEAEILFRLGEIHMRRARTERFFEVHRDSNQIVRFAPEMIKAASEVKEIRKAIGIYLDLEARFPRFRARDVVVFNTAYAYQQVGDDNKAEQQFTRLLNQHPGSPLAADALLSLGEIQYSRRQFPAALAFFTKIKEHPKARVYPYGLYKAAWCKYNMQDEGAGIKLLEEVVAFGHEQMRAAQNGASGTSGAKLDLRKEALGDLALFFSEVRKPSDAVEYFVSQAQDLDAVPYILRLVEIYKRHSKYSEVDVVLRGVLSKLPDTKQIADVHEELVWNADRQKRREVAVSQLTELDRTCDDLDKKDGGKASCDAKVVDISKKLGAKLHAYWKKDKLNETADQALRTYEVYLGNTKLVGHESAQVRYAYADLMFARSRFREASVNYAMIAEESERSEKEKNGFSLMKTDPKLAVDAAYGAVVALEKAVGDSKWSDDDEILFGKLAVRYLTRAPKGPYALDLKFKRAFIAYEKEKYDVAAKGFKELGWAADAPDHAKIVKAQDLYLDILNIRKDYTGLKEAAQALLAAASARGLEKTREEHLTKIRREAWFAEIGEMEQKGDSVKAVDTYKKFAIENRTSDLAPRAWWNASQILFKTGNASGGADMCSQMNKLFPGASNAKECLEQAAHTFEAIARVDLAAQVLMSLAEIDPAKRSHWRQVATEFGALANNRESRDLAMKSFIKQVDDTKPEMKPAQKLPLLEKAFQIAKELRDEKAMTGIRSRIEAAGLEPAASRFIVEEAEAALRSGDTTKAFNLSKRVVGRESALGDSRGLAARARFIQARVLEGEYRSQSVKARVDRIGIVLAIKTEKLEKAQRAYQSASKMGDTGVAIESHAKLADLYIDYSKTVRSMTLPSDVPESDRKAFAKEIEQIALPMEEKGIEALSQAVDAARKSARLDGLAGDLQRKLDRLNLKTDVFPKVDVEPLPRLVPGFGWRVLGSWNGGRQ